jgi:hypothetical protein
MARGFGWDESFSWDDLYFSIAWSRTYGTLMSDCMFWYGYVYGSIGSVYEYLFFEGLDFGNVDGLVS